MGSLFIKSLLLIPIFFDLVLFLMPMLSSFGLEQMFPVDLSLLYFVGIPLIIIFIYAFFILHKILTLFRQKAKLANIMATIYLENRILFLLSIVITLSTLIPLYITMFLPSLFYALDFSSPLAWIGLKLLLILLMAIAIRSLPRSKLINILCTAFISVMLGLLIFMTIEIIAEFLPNYYFTFPLDDTKGKYIINYDGDYWLTYYEVKNVEGSEVLEKKGNTSISESPVDLKPFIGIPVRIKGDFVKTNGSIYGDNKKICIGKGFMKECIIGKGPGIWYASPLKIYSIKI